MNPAENYTYRYLETDDLDQYNALLRYTFQVTEDELTATGWKDDEIKQSKFPVLERADVLGCCLLYTSLTRSVSCGMPASALRALIRALAVAPSRGPVLPVITVPSLSSMRCV